MKTFCTIVTASYFPKAVVLYRSLLEFDKDVVLEVLVAGEFEAKAAVCSYPGINTLTIESISGNPMLGKLYRKYAHIDTDQFRWALKPILLQHLIQGGLDKVIYVDCDIFFASDYDFLFKALETHDVLLTPHWQTIDPLLSEMAFLSNFTNGIFNAGFIGVNRNSIAALQWWAEACHFKMGGLYDIGIQDDQKYLDLVPVYFDRVKVVDHKGCNIGIWNKDLCRRTSVNETVLINGSLPIVFVHFTNLFMQDILKGNDPALLPLLNKYQQMFVDEGYSLCSFMKDLNYYINPPLVQKIKWRLKVRTRAKQFLYRLAESL